eukprot:2263482-Pleurochrysis_carterae.AAC.3
MSEQMLRKACVQKYITVPYLLRNTSTGHRYTVVALQVATLQPGACFEALYRRQNKFMKQRRNRTVADDSNAKKEPRKLSSMVAFKKV